MILYFDTNNPLDGRRGGKSNLLEEIKNIYFLFLERDVPLKEGYDKPRLKNTLHTTSSETKSIGINEAVKQLMRRRQSFWFRVVFDAS